MEALKEEFRSLGGSSISPDKAGAARYKNQGNISFEWKVPRPTAKATSPAKATKASTTITDDDVVAAAAFGYKAPPVAGASVTLVSPERKFVSDNYGIKSKRMALHASQHWTGKKPYGVDPTEEMSQSQGEYHPKSLADIIQKKKKATVSMAEEDASLPEPPPSKPAPLSLAAHLSRSKS
jgi:hypothetical protein